MNKKKKYICHSIVRLWWESKLGVNRCTAAPNRAVLNLNLPKRHGLPLVLNSSFSRISLHRIIYFEIDYVLKLLRKLSVRSVEGANGRSCHSSKRQHSHMLSAVILISAAGLCTLGHWGNKIGTKTIWTIHRMCVMLRKDGKLKSESRPWKARM